MVARGLLLEPMAKKNNGPVRKSAAELRRDFQSPADFRLFARQLMDQASMLDELANHTEEAGLKRLYVDGIKKFPNGLAEVAAYVRNVHKALIDAQGQQH
jgi:hypothetical protein